jgi:hypothetical protein
VEPLITALYFERELFVTTAVRTPNPTPIGKFIANQNVLAAICYAILFFDDIIIIIIIIIISSPPPLSSSRK